MKSSSNSPSISSWPGKAVETILVEQTAGTQEAGAVGSGVVGETGWEAVTLEFVCVGCGVADVSSTLGGHNLTGDVLVGETDDEPVLWGVVLVLVLGDKALASVVIGLTLAATAVLDLEPLEICFVFDELDERHVADSILASVVIGLTLA